MDISGASETTDKNSPLFPGNTPTTTTTTTIITRQLKNLHNNNNNNNNNNYDLTITQVYI